ncbi:MAG: M28 family peptidase, partial [Planctomycetia bacterium]
MLGSRGWRWIGAALLVVGGGAAGGMLLMNAETPMSAAARFPVRDVVLPDPKPTESFDGDQSYAYLKAICDLGPRMSATPAMAKQQALVENHFRALGATVVRQTFMSTQPSLRGRSFECVNLLIQWNPRAKRRVLLGAHYDTRPLADQEPLARYRDQPILGANDGASGVALLMELGRCLPTATLEIGVDFVLFDAEEYMFRPDVDKFFLGSEHFARDYAASKIDYRY